MKNLKLYRIEHGDHETIGVAVIDGKIECLVLEPPDCHNMENVSCIPAGTYECEKYYSSRFLKVCARILNVPNRTDISIHNGNTVEDTSGCLLTGKYSGYLNGKRGVLDSIRTLGALMSMLPEKFNLEIIEVSA